jgi:hypothetical protein
MSWTQAQCNECWDKDNPTRRPTVVIMADMEICCDCGAETFSGIFTRKNPRTVNFPRKEYNEQD